MMCILRLAPDQVSSGFTRRKYGGLCFDDRVPWLELARHLKRLIDEQIFVGQILRGKCDASNSGIVSLISQSGYHLTRRSGTGTSTSYYSPLSN